MDTMERQLAGLSTLVRSALITRELNPTVRQEMMELQQQILDLQTPSMTTTTQVLKAPRAVEEEDDADLTYWTSSTKENKLINNNNKNPKVSNKDNNNNLTHNSSNISPKLRQESQTSKEDLNQIKKIPQVDFLIL